MNYTNYDIIKIRTRNNEVLWSDIHGIAPAETASIMDKAMLNWLTELTNALEIWINKGEDMTIGELLLARVNIGSIVESWLRHFYTAYQENYMKNQNSVLFWILWVTELLKIHIGFYLPLWVG